MARSHLFALALGASACTMVGHATDASAPRYALDDVSRQVASGPLPCAAEPVSLVTYRGERLRYARPLRVHPAFREKLITFESIVDEVARAHFGRAPRHIVHFGAYACRSVRGRPELVSEHALGNAVDVAGFDFGPLPRKQPGFAELPKPLRGAFRVRLDEHWAAGGAGAPQAAFLRSLAARIIARPDVFRVVLGPGWPGHQNHFHFDNAPYRLVGLTL